MRVWRLARSVHPALDGEGARLYGGRWNAPGTPVVYTAGSLSLAALEQLVHLNPNRLPEDLIAYGVDIPDQLPVEEVTASGLPERWDRQVEVPEFRRIGQMWVEKEEAAALSVPSAVIPEERNYLINPRHPASDAIRTAYQRPFDFDPRLFE